MEEYVFHSGTLPEGYHRTIDVSLFNEISHLELQATSRWQSYYALNQKRKEVTALIHFHIVDTTATSLLQAPYGSVECAAEISSSLLYGFLEWVTDTLQQQGVKKIIIKNPPDAYAPSRAALLNVFLPNLKYQLTDAALGSMITVHNSVYAFQHPWEKRKLKQAMQAGLVVEALAADRFDEVYLFILACRKQKNYSLSMTLAELRTVVKNFPDRFTLFGILKDSTLVAASIAVRVTKNILYNFYSDHAPEYDHLSPVVMLIEGMHTHCITEEITQLDLGTSAVEGIPNFGLLHFKMRLGGVPTPKFTFEKIIE